jgi:hypothetical protein
LEGKLMDGHRFDNIARALAGGTSRRSVLKGLVGGLAGVVALRATHTSAQTPCQTSDDCGARQFCCRGACYDFGITICHATGSSSNPYTSITISNNGLAGHCDHTNDLILAPGEGCPTCVAEPISTTCAGVACGSATNNCGDTVECPNTCGACEMCSDTNACVASGAACGESCCDNSQQCCDDVCIDAGACCTDADCGNCETCNGAHACVPAGESCGDACCDPATQQCCNGGCIDKNACCMDDDCPDNQTCNSGQCVEQCIADGGVCSSADECCAGSTCACGVCRSGQITICHATGNASDPYDEITINVTELNAHCGDAGDLIPAPEGGCPPAVCTPESKEKTCGSDTCGTKKNNCGQSVVCGACGSNESCQNGLCVSSGGPTIGGGSTTTNGGTMSTTPTTPTEVTSLPTTGVGENGGGSRHGLMGSLAVIGGGAAFLASRLRKGAEQPEQK